jgi:Recombination endonuclease VII
LKKLCAACKEEKQIEEFYSDTTKADKLSYKCKKCNNKKRRVDSERSLMRNFRIRVNQQLADLDERMCQTCDQVKKTSEYYLNENRCKSCCIVRASGYKREKSTGWTKEEYDQAAKEQDGLCAICRNPEPVANKKLAADHCHKTGTKRGLLCSECNFLLGKAKDNPDILRAAIRYLEED